MKISLKYVLMLCMFLGVVSCTKELVPEIKLTNTNAKYALGFEKGAKVTVNFSSNTDWTVESVSEGISVTPKSGKAGNVLALTVTASNSMSEENEAKKYSFVIVAGAGESQKRTDITVNQEPPFLMEKTNYTINAEGGELLISFDLHESLDKSDILIAYDPTFASMWKTVADKEQGSTQFVRASEICTMTDSRGFTGLTATFQILPNKSKAEREGAFAFVVEKNGESLYSKSVFVKQPGSEKSGTSADYTNDGKVVTLQSHTQGAGIPIVIMGDGFLDTSLVDSTYDSAMREAYSYLFTMEPMKSLKEYFDIHYVTAVSENDVFGGDNSTAFSSKFAGGGSTEITGDDDKAVSYACKVSGISNKNFRDKSAIFKYNNMLVLVILNDIRYAGTCSIYTEDNAQRDIPRGYSVAYIPMCKNQAVGFETVLHHEAVGHGFGKLADEYYYKENDTLKEGDEDWNELKQWQGFGFYRNVDTQSDVTKCLWSHIAADSHYEAEKIGCYEGGFVWTHGVYRPSSISIMNNNTGGFNAVSREAIYKRAMMIANEGDYNYSYTDFVAFDEPSWKKPAEETRYVEIKGKEKDLHFMRPLGKPVLKFMHR